MRIALVGKGSSQLPKTWTAFLDMLLEFYKELNPKKARGMVFSKSSADSSGYVPMDIDVTEKSQGKGKKKAVPQTEILDPEGWHVCDLVCGKPLSCGNHDCEERDHRGACPSCLRSSFEEACSLNSKAFYAPY